MIPVAPDKEKLRELDEEERHAWQDYYQQIQNLTGEQYEQTEIESWEALQGQLRRIERRRRLLALGAS
ncbi:MAG: hypothetical protein ACP5H2_11940 [Solirubrobacteraceae bacterium]